MNRHNLPLAYHAATDMGAIGWVMIVYSSNCFISPGWLASIAEGDSIINATLLYYIQIYSFEHLIVFASIRANKEIAKQTSALLVYN